MKTSDFYYDLPEERIAQESVSPRDSSRMMVIDRAQHTAGDRTFRDIVEYLQPGDVLVRNVSHVFKARLKGYLQSPDGQPLMHHTDPVEIFLVRPSENEGVWNVMVHPVKHISVGMQVKIADDFICEIVAGKRLGTLLAQFSYSDDEVRAKANQYGKIPIPPYVKDEPLQLESYQTVYSDPTKEGSVAAPTAGFHFTPELIHQLEEKGIEFVDITLHVGMGTFLPVKTASIDKHIMHSEWVEVSHEAATAINRAKAEGRRVITIGTTSTRTIEGVAAQSDTGGVHEFSGDVDIFIQPGFEFNIVDAIITNFHLPQSTLLMLISAFIGNVDETLGYYQQAVEKKYRFYSFGDAMFIY